jgi:hypothetical protein
VLQKLEDRNQQVRRRQVDLASVVRLLRAAFHPLAILLWEADPLWAAVPPAVL